MFLAKEVIRTILVINGSDKNKILRGRTGFLVQVESATVEGTQIDLGTKKHLKKILEDIVDGVYDKIIIDRCEGTRWAMEIANWLHGVHMVLKNNTSPL